MKRIIAIAAGVLAMLGAGIGVSNADSGTNNDHGMCTAYFNGQKNGHGEGEEQDNQPPPFEELETTGEGYTNTDGVDNDDDGGTDASDPTPPEDSELTDAENIFNYCDDRSTIGGQPSHGRFTCVDTLAPDADGSDSETNPECNDNDDPGKS